MKYNIKRSMSPDGKIDSVSVEILDLDTEDPQLVIDAITLSDKFAAHVRKNVQPGRALEVFKTSNGGQTTSSGGQDQTLTGTIQAVYKGDIKPGGTKPGPGAIIISGTKVKTFDKKMVALAEEWKANGVEVEAVYFVNEKWNSNDLKSLRAAG